MILKINSPEWINVVNGVYSDSCLIDLTDAAIKNLKNKSLRVIIKSKRADKLLENVKISLGDVKGNLSISVADDCMVHLDDCVGGQFNLILSDHSNILIGKRTTSNGVDIYAANSTFKCGEDWMFSSGILIQTSDQHAIVDLQSKKIINYFHKETILDEHVWLGRNCTLMPDLRIGSGSLIGTGSIVTNNIDNHCIAVGVPARVVRRDVTWSRSSNSLDGYSKALCESK